jgi:hypothetical protein
MSILDILIDPSAKWDSEAPASSEIIRKLVAESNIELPEEYLALLLCSNGGEGELALEPGWFQLWPGADGQPCCRLASVLVQLSRGHRASCQRSSA